MATTVTSAPGHPLDSRQQPEPAFAGTMSDPRQRSLKPNPPRTDSTPVSHHPELNSEVAALSNKLINAINHQTNLDDSLAATRHELEASQERVRQLEAGQREHADMIAKGSLVKRADLDGELCQLMVNLEEEQRQRATAEKDKKSIELELENLTSALFEEANKMVSAARKERDSTERKNEQLKSKMADMEILLASHQEQLAELKSVMQTLGSERGDLDTNTNASTVPSTPSLTNHEHWSKSEEALHSVPNTPNTGDIPPSHPTSFSHLIHPVLRTDLHAYEDFTLLLQSARNSAAPSRVSSGSYGGLNVMGLSTVNGNSATVIGQMPSNGSTSSISTAGTAASSPATPSTPASSVSNTSFRETPALKESRFYKRVLAEDVEPTLRLETAPGLSWLARRTVLNSMSEGTLVVEPMPPKRTIYMPSCSLCGENRKGEEYARKHRFRTSESETAQRYPLCNYCLGRVRATCEFLGFLRMVKDGHWRTDSEEAEKAAWEESIKLRESMFWARLGGGVVPAFIQIKEESRPSSSTADRSGIGLKSNSNVSIHRSHEDAKISPAKDEDSKTVIPGVEATHKGTASAADEGVSEVDFMPKDLDAQQPEQEKVTQKIDESKTSPVDTASAKSGKENRLSITIPGSLNQDVGS